MNQLNNKLHSFSFSLDSNKEVRKDTCVLQQFVTNYLVANSPTLTLMTRELWINVCSEDWERAVLHSPTNQTQKTAILLSFTYLIKKIVILNIVAIHPAREVLWSLKHKLCFQSVHHAELAKHPSQKSYLQFLNATGGCHGYYSSIWIIYNITHLVQ